MRVWPFAVCQESLKLSKTKSFSSLSWLSLRLGLLVKSVLLPSSSLRHAGHTTDMTCPCLPLTLLCSFSILYHHVSSCIPSVCSVATRDRDIPQVRIWDVLEPSRHLPRAAPPFAPSANFRLQGWLQPHRHCLLRRSCSWAHLRLLRKQCNWGQSKLHRVERFTNPKNIEHPLTKIIATEPTSGQQSLSQFQPSGHHCCRR